VLPVSLAHREGLKLHGWKAVFRISSQVGGRRHNLSTGDTCGPRTWLRRSLRTPPGYKSKG